MSDAFQALSRRVLPLAAAVGFDLAATPALARGPDGIADVAEKVIDAVVNISTSQTVEAKNNDGDKGSDERGNRMGTGLILGVGAEAAEALTGKEVFIFIGDNGQVGADAWVLDLSKGLKLVPVPGLAVKGGVKEGKFTFELSFPLTQFFGEGKVPQAILANAWGRNLKGRTDVSVAGTGMMSLERPYTWADVAIKQSE